MNGHQLDRYRRHVRQRSRMLWRKYLVGGRTDDLFHSSMCGDPALDPWCSESHEECRRHRVGGKWPTPALFWWSTSTPWPA